MRFNGFFVALFFGLSTSTFADSPTLKWAAEPKCQGNLCSECAPSMSVQPDPVHERIAHDFHLTLRVPGLSAAGRCSVEGYGSVDWGDQVHENIPTKYKPVDACAAGNILAPTGDYFDIHHAYKTRGTYTITIYVRSKSMAPDGKNAMCHVKGTMRAAID